MKIKVCLLLIFGFLLFAFSRAEASITWTGDVYEYNATDQAGVYYNPTLGWPVLISASTDRSQQNGDSEDSTATVSEPPQGVSTPGLNMSSGAWGNVFQNGDKDSGGASVYAFANNSYSLDSPAGVSLNGQNVSSYIDRGFTVSANQSYVLSASATVPLDWSGTTTGTATAPQPQLTGSVYLLQTDADGNTTTVQSFSLSTLLSSSQQVTVSLVSGDIYQFVVALSGVAPSLGSEVKPAGIVTTFNNLDNAGHWLGNIDGAFNVGTATNPVSITASIAPVASLWEGAVALGDGWQYLGWFGYFNTTYSPWIYHNTLGWLYPFATSTDDIWFYDPQWDGGQGGFWWTSASAWPWVYTSDGNWYYFDPGNSTVSARWFCTLDTGCSKH